jgi:transposase
MKAARFTADEIERVSYLTSKGYLPVAVDVASRVFQVCYYDLGAKHIRNYQLSRVKFFEFIDDTQMPRKLIGIEACGSCNYLCRYIEEHNHKCHILPAQKVKAFLHLDKTDRIDALGILKALITPSMQHIPARTQENQYLLNLITVREQLNKQFVQTVNAAHAILYESGVVAGTVSVASATKVTEALKALCNTETEKEHSEDDCSYSHLNCISESLLSNIESLQTKIKKINTHLLSYASNNEICSNLQTVPGIGKLSAVALYAAIGDPERFSSSRAFAAFIGVAPVTTGTGGKTTVLGIRKSGIQSIKKMLYMCAMVYLSQAMKNGTESSWLKLKLNQNRSKKIIICAIMNRLARIAYAIAKSGQPFDENKCNMIKKLR